MINNDIDTLKQIIESSPSELVLINTKDNIFYDHFKSARRAYFLNDIEKLKKELDFFNLHTSDWLYSPMCSSIIQIRIQIREMHFTEETNHLINSSNDYLGKKLDLIEQTLLVELLAVEAILCDLMKKYDLCYQKNMKAVQIADALDLKKKASTLNYNGVVALNHDAPTKLKISYLVEAANKAEEAKDFNTQAAALTSLAQEYETLECYNIAYEECSKAFAIAKKYSFGTYNFCYITLLCARLAVNSRRLDIATEKIKIVEVFDFVELKEQIQKTKDLLENKIESEGLSGDEQKLIFLLTSGPKHKYELIENIYGQGDIESLDNRLKQLFLRLRKKKLGLISYNKKESLYELMQ